MTRKHPKLADVARPNLYREMFPYTDFPKVIFDNKTVDYDFPKEIWITDTTFRDGQQARPPYTPKQILRVYDFLHEIDGGTGLIRQCEFFLYSKRDREAVELCQARGYDFPEITGWIRAIRNDFKLVSEMGLKETGILTSASDYHIFLKLRKTRAQALESYLDIVKAALDSGVIPRCHFEDITRADYEGFVLPFAAELMKLALTGRIRNRATIRIAILADGKEIAARNVNFNLKYTCSKVVALVDIAKGQTITAENVRIDKSVSDYPQAADWTAPYGFVARRQIAANSTIRPLMVALPAPSILIKRNERVVVRIARTGLVVTALAKALQQGQPGDCIKVRNVDSNRIILVTVNDDGTVKPVF